MMDNEPIKSPSAFIVVIIAIIKPAAPNVKKAIGAIDTLIKLNALES